MDNINKEIGRKIKTKRNEIGFKQEVLASELGISQSALSRMENGVEDISVIVLLKLSQIFNIHVSYFIADSLKELVGNSNGERLKLFEEMLQKNEILIKQHVDIIKQLEEQIKELHAKIERKNKKIEELKQINSIKNLLN